MNLIKKLHLFMNSIHLFNIHFLIYYRKATKNFFRKILEYLLTSSLYKNQIT